MNIAENKIYIIKLKLGVVIIHIIYTVMIFFYPSIPMEVAQLPLSVNDGRWHHICITWTTRDGFWETYQDGQKLGSGENLAPWHPIKPDGVLILGQEQVRIATIVMQEIADRMQVDTS